MAQLFVCVADLFRQSFQGFKADTCVLIRHCVPLPVYRRLELIDF